MHIFLEKRKCLSKNYLALERREVICLCPRKLFMHPRLVLFKAHGDGAGVRAAAEEKGRQREQGKQMPFGFEQQDELLPS